MKALEITPRHQNDAGSTLSPAPMLPVESDQVVAAVRRDLLLYELSQLVLRLHDSSGPEPVCGSLVRKFEPMIQAGLVTVNHPTNHGDPITVTRVCPPRILRNYFWGSWLPAYYKQLGQLPAARADKEVSCCTVVLAFPDKRVNLKDVILDLSLRLEVSGVAEITHIEGGDAALHREYVEVEVKP